VRGARYRLFSEHVHHTSKAIVESTLYDVLGEEDPLTLLIDEYHDTVVRSCRDVRYITAHFPGDQREAFEQLEGEARELFFPEGKGIGNEIAAELAATR